MFEPSEIFIHKNRNIKMWNCKSEIRADADENWPEFQSPVWVKQINLFPCDWTIYQLKNRFESQFSKLAWSRFPFRLIRGTHPESNFLLRDFVFSCNFVASNKVKAETDDMNICPVPIWYQKVQPHKAKNDTRIQREEFQMLHCESKRLLKKTKRQ